ncbi:MAG: OmpA family protein [Magnetococcales bacterium]|nr:OmpA family protein [Magnetococcales bacterium]
MSNIPDNVIINLDGERFLLKGRSCRPLPTLDAVRGDKWVVTDFRGAPAFHMSVESPVRYAELLAHRQLQERGEASQHARVLTHWKQGRTASLSELFFTVVEKETATSYFDMALADSDHHLVFPIHAVLFDVLVRSSGRNKNVAVLFDHDRHVDVLIGHSGRVAGSQRVSTHSSTPEGKADMVDALREELKSMASKAHIRLDEIVYLNWVIVDESESHQGETTDISFGASADDVTMATFGGQARSVAQTGLSRGTSASRTELVMSASWARHLAEELKVKCRVPNPTRFMQEGNQVLVTSLPAAFAKLSYRRAGNTLPEIVRYGAEQAVVPLLTLFWVLIAGVYLGHLMLAQKTRSLEGQVRAEKAKITEVESVQPVPKESTAVVDFVKRLSALYDMPAPRAMLVELSESVPAGMQISLNKISFDYDARMTPTMTLDGYVDGGFKVAEQLYAALMANMKKRGYVTESEKLSTDVQRIDFVTALRREHAQPKNIVVLLPGEDGAVGKVEVSNKGGRQELDTASAAIGIDDPDTPPTKPFTMNQDEIQAAFGKALQAKPETPLKFILNFTSGGTELTEESKARLTELLEAVAKRTTPPTVEVVGHTDTVGSADKNWRLALDRAQSVRDKLVSIGVKPEQVNFSSHGKGNLLIPTADEVAEPRNRRVEVTVQ